MKHQISISLTLKPTSNFSQGFILFSFPQNKQTFLLLQIESVIPWTYISLLQAFLHSIPAFPYNWALHSLFQTMSPKHPLVCSIQTFRRFFPHQKYFWIFEEKNIISRTVPWYISTLYLYLLCSKLPPLLFISDHELIVHVCSEIIKYGSINKTSDPRSSQNKEASPICFGQSWIITYAGNIISYNTIYRILSTSHSCGIYSINTTSINASAINICPSIETHAINNWKFNLRNLQTASPLYHLVLGKEHP